MGSGAAFPLRGALRDLFESCGPCWKKAPGEKKTASFGKSLGAQRLWQIYLAIWQIILHETDDGEVMKMQAHYTDPLKPARPPLSTTP